MIVKVHVHGMDGHTMDGVRGADAIADAIQRECAESVSVDFKPKDDGTAGGMIRFSRIVKFNPHAQIGCAAKVIRETIGLMPRAAIKQAALHRGEALLPFAFEMLIPRWAVDLSYLPGHPGPK